MQVNIDSFSPRDTPTTVSQLTNMPAAQVRQPAKRLSIEGVVLLKRTRRWVTRYAQIKEAFFQYKNERNDIKARYMLDLRRAIIRKGYCSNGDKYIEISERDQMTG